jgi:uncharacterized protein YcnI
MSRTRTSSRARWVALPAVAGLITLMSAAPASAHVTVTPSETAAGSYTVLTVALSHGCDGSATTALDVQIPEQLLSVTPARSPFWEAEVKREQLAEPVTDAHGNEVTERVSSVVFTATEALPDGVRDSVELTFQIPEDAAGETLAFPTIQECEQGETAWTQLPEEGQDAHELETPAPSFEVLPAEDAHGDEEAAHDEEAAAADAPETVEDDDEMLGWAGLGAGLLGLLAGGTALVRSRSGS